MVILAAYVKKAIYLLANFDPGEIMLKFAEFMIATNASSIKIAAVNTIVGLERFTKRRGRRNRFLWNLQLRLILYNFSAPF